MSASHNSIELLGLTKSPFSFFRKIRHFSFSPLTIDLSILSMSAISYNWLVVGRGQRCC